MLLVWGYGGESCTTTILPDKEDKDHYHQGKIVIVQLSPPELQKSNIDAIAGFIGGVLVAIVVGVILVIFIR
jgi:hypothetical protein